MEKTVSSVKAKVNDDYKDFADDIDLSGGLIPALQTVQEHYGYLPQEIFEMISERSGIPLSRVYGVVTFYAQFSLKPRGKHTIKVCKGTACHVKGAEIIAEALKEELGVEVGDTTEDTMFTLEKVACLGTCFLAPVMMIDDSYYGELNIDKIKNILTEFTAKAKG
jgi:NADH-quinone oxidoreductase subunit E